MKGNFHGPGGKLMLELLSLHFVTILNSTNRKRKEEMKVIIKEKLL
jgi:hypothetical protein